MKAIGIVRCIDPLGRVVIPKELRRTLDIKDGDPMEIYTDGNDIILRKYNPGCMMCGGVDGPISRGGNKMCCKCVDLFAKEDVQRR